MGGFRFSNENPGAWQPFLRAKDNMYGKSMPSKLCYHESIRQLLALRPHPSLQLINFSYSTTSVYHAHLSRSNEHQYPHDDDQHWTVDCRSLWSFWLLTCPCLGPTCSCPPPQCTKAPPEGCNRTINICTKMLNMFYKYIANCNCDTFSTNAIHGSPTWCP